MKKIARNFLLITMALFMATIDTGQTFAATRQGPDPAYSSRAMNYTVSRDGFTDITRNDFRIYTSRIDNGVTVRIYGHNLCGNRPAPGVRELYTMSARGVPRTTDETYNEINVGYGDVVTNYELRTMNGSERVNRNGHRRSRTTCDTRSNFQSVDLRISAARLRDYARDNTIGRDGMYQFRLSVVVPRSVEGLVNGFRLEVLNDNRAVISQEAGSDSQRARDFGIQIASPRNSSAYGNFQIPFGPDCSVLSGGSRAAIYLYDLDNPNSGIQPNTLRVRVSRYDSDRNRLRTEPITISGASRVNNSSSGYRIIRAGDQTTVRINFTARPQYKYSLDIDRLFNNNTLQLSIPYSTVWFTRDCLSVDNTAQLTPDLTLQPNDSVLTVGSQFRANFSAEETGGEFNANMRSGVARVWRENNGNDRFGAGDESLHQETFSNRTIRAGRTFSDQFSWPVSDVGSGRICASWNVTAGSRTQIAGDDSITRCKWIGKYPSLNVIGGDIRAGAGSSQGNIIGRISTIGGNRYGSWTEYGMFAPGGVSSLASGGVLSNNLRSTGRVISPLIFANSPISQGLGNFQPQMDARSTPVSSIFSATEQLAATTEQDINCGNYQIRNQPGVHRIESDCTGTITLTAQNNIRGVVMINAPDARVVIGANIRYDNDGAGGYGSVTDIPLVLINAESVRFGSSVTQVDAGIQSAEAISTCGNERTGDYYDGLTLNNCSRPLLLNGFVSAGSLHLRRTAGADGTNDRDRARAAETINLRASDLLRINDLTRNGDISIHTTSIRELPPRL